MSRFIKDGKLQPGKYTISAQGFFRIGSAEEASGFDGTSDVYAYDFLQDDIFFDVRKNCLFTLKNDETGEEETLTAFLSNDSGVLIAERDESSDAEDEDAEDEAAEDEETEAAEDEEAEDEEPELFFEDDVRPEQVIATDVTDEYYPDTDVYYFEEYCAEGVVQKSLEIQEPLDLTGTTFKLYGALGEYRVLLGITFPGFGQVDQVVSRGKTVLHYYSILYEEVTSVKRIQQYLEGLEEEDFED